MRNISVERLYTKCDGETIPRPLSKLSKLADPHIFWAYRFLEVCDSLVILKNPKKCS